MEVEKAKTLELLAQAGLPSFDLGADGYPLPGKVIKYYREQMKYTDIDGKVKHWTQAELAQRLGVTDIMVNIMENQNKGLDSIERRRTLATILRIPPALLGLGSLDQLVEIATGHGITTLKQGATKRAKIDVDTIKQYETQLAIYGKLYANGVACTSVTDIERWVKTLEQDTKSIQTDNKAALLRLLWDYELLCTSVYGSDLQNWSKAFEHIDNALDVATYLDDRDLQAASLYIKSVYHLRQGRAGLARVDLDGALLYAKGALPQTKGAIHSQNARIHAKEANALNVVLTQKSFDEAEQYADVNSEIITIKYGMGIHFIKKASTLITIGRPGKALELLDDAERRTIPKRYLVFLDILRAKCYIEQKKPEYEQAVSLLGSAIEDSKVLKATNNIHQIENAYVKLLASSYGNSPDI